MPLHFTPISELILTSVPYKIKVRIARLWGYEKPDRPGVITGLNLILVDEKGSRIEASLSQGIFRNTRSIYGNTSFQVLKLCLDRSEIEKFKEEADKKEASLDQNSGAISISSDPSAGNVIQEAILEQIPVAISQFSDHSDANAIQVPPIDQNPAALTLSSDHSASNSIERGNTSESRELNVMTEPFTPIPKRPLNVVVEDEQAQQSSTKGATPQSVNKPKKVFVKREKKN